MATYQLAQLPQETLRDNVRFIISYTIDHDRPPTRREMMKPFGVTSVNTVEYRLRVLAREGYIFLEREIARGVRATAKGLSAAGLGESWPLRLLPLDVDELRYQQPTYPPSGSVAAYVDTKAYCRIFYMIDEDLLSAAAS